MTWAVTDTNALAIPCSQVGGNFVTVTLRNRAVQGGSTEVFSCSSLMATSLLSFAPGIYDLSFELGGTVGLLTTAPTATGIEFKNDQTAAVPPVTFAVDATGKMDLFVNSGVVGGNCAGGAGINNTTITLAHSGGGVCEPVTFNISAGATGVAGTYTVNCAAPVQAGCINNDQKLSVPTLPSGGYQIQVKGKIGGTDCWTNTTNLTVPPLSKTLMQTLNLSHQVITGC